MMRLFSTEIPGIVMMDIYARTEAGMKKNFRLFILTHQALKMNSILNPKKNDMPSTDLRKQQ
jgi:hypothetical protein